MSGLRSCLIGFFLALIPSSALAGIEQAKALQCSGGGEAFTVIFDHEGERARITNQLGTRSYRYQQGDAFLTWRLLDDNGQQDYLLRQGDAVNGDLGWYFTFTLDHVAQSELTTGGTCSAVE